MDFRHLKKVLRNEQIEHCVGCGLSNTTGNKLLDYEDVVNSIDVNDLETRVGNRHLLSEIMVIF